MSGVRLAPALVVRAAAWPLELLAPFGDRALSALAATASPADPAGWQRYGEAYARVLARESEYLWQATVGDPAFGKALTLANPLAAQLAREVDPSRGRNNRFRRAEGMLYRYLARAVGRTEPCDRWAGIALATWASRTRVAPAAPGYRFAPDLRPFQTILRALAARPAYRGAGRWRVTPTLRHQPGDGWTFWARLPDGALVERGLGDEPLVDATLRVLRRAPALPWERLVERLRCRVGLDAPTAAGLLDALADGGVVVGGLDLPHRLATPWEALARAGRSLLGDDRTLWRATVRTLRRICRRLEARFDRLSVDDLDAYLAEARALVLRLAEGLDVPLDDLPRAVLRCDYGLPFQVELGPELRERLQAAIEEYDQLQEACGPAAAVRQSQLERLRGRLAERLCLTAAGDGLPAVRGGPAPRTWQDLASQGPDGLVAAARIARWERLLATPVAEVTIDPLGPEASAGETPLDPSSAAAAGAAGSARLDGAPLGCLLVGLSAAPGQPVELAIHGLTDEVAPLYARYAGLWNRTPARPRDPLYGWLRGALDDLAARHAIRLVELVGPHEANPNVLAHPPFPTGLVDLWSVTPRATSLRGARLFLDPTTARPFVRLRSDARPAVVCSFSSADHAAGDPFSALLLRTSFRDAPEAHFRASALAFACELSTARLSPRVRLPGGDVLRRRRTVLSGAALAELSQGSGPERYARWQRLVHEHGWPALVTVRRDGGPALPVPTASPLALEAVLRSVVDAEAQSLTIEEFGGTPWLVDAAGRHYLAELAVPFERTAHAWSARELSA